MKGKIGLDMVLHADRTSFLSAQISENYPPRKVCEEEYEPFNLPAHWLGDVCKILS